MAKLSKVHHKNDKILRYLSFDKFIDMVNFNRIYFRQVDRFDDHFEGCFTKPVYDIAKSITIINPEGIENNDGIIKNTKLRRQMNYVSCWTQTKAESMALWQLYTGKNGVAIQTTTSRLKEEIENSVSTNMDETHSIIRLAKFRVSQVTYVDHNNDDSKKNKTKILEDPIMLKNIGYDFEREVRFAFDTIYPGIHERLGKGFFITIDVNRIIENCIISPFASQDFYEFVESIFNKYQINGCVSWSNLKFTPFHNKFVNT